MANRTTHETSLSFNASTMERRATYTASLTPSLRRWTLDRPYDLEENIQEESGVFKSMDEGTPLLNVSTSEPPQLSTQPVADGAEKEEKAKVKKRVRFLEEETKQKQRYDSLDYDICYNVPYKEKIWKYSKKTYILMEALRWILVGIIGILTGLVAFIIDFCVKHLIEIKFELFDRFYDMVDISGDIMFGFLILLGFNILFAIVASFLVTLEPVAAGSGIPEIKCYLNGVKIPHVNRVGTLIAKAGGVLFSVAAGFFVGKEGPMIHSGAIIGAGIPQFRSLFLKFIKLPFSFFRSDRDKRDFVSSGAAAGVAAAFGAPIGGVLFSLEEGSSFWNQALTWRTLFCSFCATFTLHIFLSLSEGDKFGYLRLGSPGLVNFGTFGQDENKLWNAYHLIVFMLMGAVGGLLGALFNHFNVNLTKYRMKYLHRRHRIWRIPEAVLIIMVTTACVFLTATFLGTCFQNKHISEKEKLCPELFGDISFRNDTRSYFCPGHGISAKSSSNYYYNDMASLVFNSQEVAIKQLFHQNGAFSLPTLGMIFLTYFFVTCWTYGAAIPSGLFIPSIMIGASYGRFVAGVFGYLYTWKPDIFQVFVSIYPGTYALIGAASFLGGVVRMTISLTVILIESTNEISYGLPIMLTLMVAKWVGDLFNKGLYDHHIELKSTPFLGWESPERMDRLIAADVMSSNNLCYVYPITRVKSVETLLRTTAYSAFLVVTPVEPDYIPERPMNVQDSHIPQLYGRRPFTSGDWTVTDEDTDRECKQERQLHVLNPPAKDGPQQLYTDTDGDSTSRDSQLMLSYTIHHSSVKGGRTAATRDRSSSTVRDEQREEVVTPASGGKLLMFHGIILRSQLIELIKHKVFFSEGESSEKQRKISHAELTSDYPRYPNLDKAIKDLTTTERHMLMDLSLYMNPCPYTISHEAPLPQVFNLFRTMGLRHLPVMQESGIVVGIITRHDLTHENLHEKYEEKKTKDKEQRRITREREARTFATSMNINRTLVQHADVEADSEYGNFV